MTLLHRLVCSSFHRRRWLTLRATNLDYSGEWRRESRQCERCGRKWTRVRHARKGR
ncbi:hypothetical protein [Limnoglobus roseus]|uniref:hypothetical protein n=1 Tax=Limnoglobus roseus TaxID=2598579 RepID=UPI00143D657F|nr:hypothetical protein [Limnoglobus roseus]